MAKSHQRESRDRVWTSKFLYQLYDRRVLSRPIWWPITTHQFSGLADFLFHVQLNDWVHFQLSFQFQLTEISPLRSIVSPSCQRVDTAASTTSIELSRRGRCVGYRWQVCAVEQSETLRSNIAYIAGRPNYVFSLSLTSNRVTNTISQINTLPG